jgi:hypothetical protein
MLVQEFLLVAFHRHNFLFVCISLDCPFDLFVAVMNDKDMSSSPFCTTQHTYILPPSHEKCNPAFISHKECNSRNWISTTCLIKWSDLICMPKLTACGKPTRV